MSRADSSGGYGLYDSVLDPARQRDAFLTGAVPVAVYGLGKMGLPLASVFADVSGNVVGVDIDEDVVARTNAGDCHVTGEPGLDDLVTRLVDRGALRATTDARTAARNATIHVIIVPTLLGPGDEPDLSAITAVIDEIGRGVTPGDLVVVESTVPPRTCVDELLPRLSRRSGLDPRNFGLAFCPERTKSGQAIADIRGTHPKIVGGVDEESTRTAALIYDEISSNRVITVSDATTAEAVKLFEGLYRDVNIALANELGTFADELGIDVTEAIEIANTQPFCDIHDPGPGVGGHCIPYYPYFLISPFRTEAPLLQTAREVNEGMPSFVVEQLTAAFSSHGRDVEGATVLVLGLTYRPGVSETRASPARPIAASLDARGCEVLAVDPMLESAAGFDATKVQLSDIYHRDPDGAVLVTHHEEFDAIEWDRFDDPLVVVDGRRELDLEDTRHHVYAIGRGKS